MNCSVVICTFNRAELLNKTLFSLLRLHVPQGLLWELIVVNNRCTDETSTIISEFRDRLPIREILEDRSGKSYAANRGVEESMGELILWTDDDVEVDPNWLKNMYSAYRRHHADMVFGKVMPLWEGEPAAWYSAKTAALLACLDLGDEETVTTESGFGVNYAFPRAIFDKIGPFDVNLGPQGADGFGGEDTTIFRRAHELGMRVVYCPHAIINHWVPIERCTKRYHRSRVSRSIGQFSQVMNAQYPNSRKLMAVPLFLYRKAFGQLIDLFIGSLLLRKDQVMYSELKLLRFVSLWIYERKKSSRFSRDFDSR